MAHFHSEIFVGFTSSRNMATVSKGSVSALRLLQDVADVIPKLSGKLYENAQSLQRLHKDVEQESQRVTPSSAVKLQDLRVSLNNVVVKIKSCTNACLDLATFGSDDDLCSSIEKNLEKRKSEELVDFLEILQSYAKTIGECLDDVLREVAETETFILQNTTAGDPSNVSIAGNQHSTKYKAVGYVIATFGSICGCVMQSFFVTLGSFLIGTVVVDWYGGVLRGTEKGGRRGGGGGDHGGGADPFETRLTDSLKKQLLHLKQEVTRRREVVETLEEKLENCISHGDFDSGASDGATNIVNTCNKLKMTIEGNS